MERLFFIVDGSNVAYFKRNDEKRPKISNIFKMRSYLEEFKVSQKIEYEIVIDAPLIYCIDDRKTLEQEYLIGNVTKCPQGQKADEYIVQFFNIHPANTYIISNDNFRGYNLQGSK